MESKKEERVQQPKKQYVKKGEKPQEEKKVENKVEKKEEKTEEKPKREYKGDYKPKYVKREGNQDEEGNEYAEKREPRYKRIESPAQNKYYAPRPRREKIIVTLETEIAGPVPKDQRLKVPDEKVYQTEREKIFNDVNALEKKKDEIRKTIKEKRAGGNVGESGLTLVEYKKTKHNLKNELHEKREFYNEEINRLKAKIGQISDDKKEIMKKAQGAKTVAELERKIKETHNKIYHSSVSIQEEKKLQQELKEMTQVQPLLKKIENSKDEIDKFNVEIKDNKAKKEAIWKDIEEVNKEIADTNSKLGVHFSQQDSTKKDIASFQEEIETINTNIEEVRTKLLPLMEDYYTKLYDYEIQQDEMKQSEFLQKIKDRLVADEEWKKKLEEEKKLEEPFHPFQEEIDLCEHLLNFCKKMANIKISAKEDEVKNEISKESEQKKKEDLEKKIKSGELVAAKGKREREEEDVMFKGTRKGKKSQKNKQKSAVEETDKGLSLNIETIKYFAKVSVATPLSKDDLEDTIKKIEDKKKEYEGKTEADYQEENKEDIRRKERAYKKRGGRRDEDQDESSPREEKPRRQAPKAPKDLPNPQNEQEWPAF